jgi:hypothetical protein
VPTCTGSSAEGGKAASALADARQILLFFDTDAGHTNEPLVTALPFSRGNQAVLHHRMQRRYLRLFQGVGGIVTYVARFEIDTEDPYEIVEARESGVITTRKVIILHLVALGEAP